jgi:Ca-activated chloride channel family protein
MLLALLAFRRGGAFAALLLCASLPLAMPAQAAEGGWWQRADQQQHERIERGVDAYRKGDFKGAGEAFAGIGSADALYNQGNALAKQGRYDEAIAAYDQALQRQPGMEDAVENRKVVDAARKRKNPPGQSPKNQGRQDPGKDGYPGQAGSPGQDPPAKASGTPSPGQSPPADPASAQPQGPAPAPGSSASDRAGTPKPAPPAADPKTQQAADAAQRERMRQALAEPGKGGTKPGQAQVATAEESAQEREKRQAVDAWLRRVPDDPGGLLKAKFRLEYERRQKDGR